MNCVTILLEYQPTFIRNYFNKYIIVSKILFIGSLFFIKSWAVVYFGFHMGGIIHILPAIAILALLIWIFYNKTTLQRQYRLAKAYFHTIPYLACKQAATKRFIGNNIKKT
jgi:hypothetical protein